VEHLISPSVHNTLQVKDHERAATMAWQQLITLQTGSTLIAVQPTKLYPETIEEDQNSLYNLTTEIPNSPPPAVTSLSELLPVLPTAFEIAQQQSAHEAMSYIHNNFYDAFIVQALAAYLEQGNITKYGIQATQQAYKTQPRFAQKMHRFLLSSIKNNPQWLAAVLKDQPMADDIRTATYQTIKPWRLATLGSIPVRDKTEIHSAIRTWHQSIQEGEKQPSNQKCSTNTIDLTSNSAKFVSEAIKNVDNNNNNTSTANKNNNKAVRNTATKNIANKNTMHIPLTGTLIVCHPHQCPSLCLQQWLCEVRPKAVSQTSNTIDLTSTSAQICFRSNKKC